MKKRRRKPNETQSTAEIAVSESTAQKAATQGGLASFHSAAALLDSLCSSPTMEELKKVG